MLIVCIKDKLAKKIVHIEPTQSVDVFKRNIVNAMKAPQSLLGSNSSDFDCYTLAEYDEVTGSVDLDSNMDFLFNLSELKPNEGI